MTTYKHSLQIDALTDQIDDPTDAMQYCVLDKGERHVYGDQSWVRWGGAVRDSHPDGRVQRRRITITYGEWEDAP